MLPLTLTWSRIAPFIPYIVGSALLTYILLILVRGIAQKYNIVSPPRKRDMHSKPTPRLGGVAIVSSFIIIFATAQLLSPDILWFTDEMRFGFDRHLAGIILGAVILLIFGIWDDIKNLSPGWQIFGQVLAAAAIIFSGIGIDFVTNPFGPHGSVIFLNQYSWDLFTIGGYTTSITLWSDLFTLIWLVGMMNVMNWFDGLDGLASGVTGIAAFLLAYLSAAVGSPVGIIAMLVILCGAMIGFLPWNWYPAKIFMGTSGSTFLGFILGVAAIISGGKIATALLVLGVPVLDALWVVARRLFAGKSIFKADRMHLHHRLVDSGLSVRTTVLILYGISFVFGFLALLKNNTGIKLQLALVLALLVVIIGLGTMVSNRRQRA